MKRKDAAINNLHRDKEGLIAMMYSLGGAGEGERVQSSRNNDKFGTLYSRIDEKEREITEKIDALVDFKLKVSDEINALDDDRHIAILHKRYVCFESWERIAIDMQYNVRYVQHLHGQALAEFAELHDDVISIRSNMYNK